MLEAINLTKSYGSYRALDNLNLSIAAGEIFCLLGANGAGKTTTINLFLDFIRPDSGSARVNGVTVAEQPLETKKDIAYLPENVTLYGSLTGLENLRCLSSLAGPWRYSEVELEQFLLRAGLQKEAHKRRVSQYSKGMRQKAGIAVALAKRAKALLLDKPTSGLDPKASNEFSSLIEELAAQGVAVLMATHDFFRAKESGTRVGIMREGTLREVLYTSEIGHSELEKIYLTHMHGGLFRRFYAGTIL